MIRIRLTMTDVSQVRFGLSPLSETVLSLRALATRPALHGPWLRQVEGIDTGLLQTLVRPAGYIPDFLLPRVPARSTETKTVGLSPREATFDKELSRLANQDPHEVATQLRRLKLGELADDPEQAVTRITAELRSYHRKAIEPYWPRIRALLKADLAYRLDELATGGVKQVLRTLHPLVTHRGEFLDVVKYWDGAVELGQRGLLLVPCVFAWPDVIVRSADPQPAMTYSPRGLGRLWEKAGDRRSTALADLVGKTRAAVLAQLDLPTSTTQLACLLDLTPPTLSVHLKTLEAAGVVTALRDGRSVLYRRTPLGDELVSR